MDIRATLKSQYHAALKTLRLEIEQCPNRMWADPADGPAQFWRVVYHTLFYADFYSLQDAEQFEPWAKNWRGAETLEGIAAECQDAPQPYHAYSRAELLEYWSLCDGRIDARIDALDLEAPQCGFPWVHDGNARTPVSKHPPHSASRGNLVRAVAQSGGHQYWLGGQGISTRARKMAT